MDEKLLAQAMPAFMLLLAVEALVAWRRGRKLFALHDTLTSLACGAGQTILGLWLNVVIVLVYTAMYRRTGFFDLPREGAFALSLCVLAVDFCHYWFHRSSHRVNALWAGHAVHHQSEQYNLSTALRQSWAEPLQSLPFYLPLAVLGFSPELFLYAHTVQTIYQFWIHTRLVDRLGPLEWVLNTPSHHRVHHAINPRYIDKNYAGIFILWDRFFGTFEPESEEAAYGTVKPLASFDPFWANAYEWVRIAALSYASGTLREALYAPVAPPEWLPASMGGAQPVPPVSPRRRLFDTHPGRALSAYAAVHLGLALAATAVFTGRAQELPGWLAIAAALWVLAGLGVVGALLHRRQRALWVEALRLASAPALGLWTLGPAGLALGLLVAGGSVAGFPARFWWNKP